jgi:hypothetical protein
MFTVNSKMNCELPCAAGTLTRSLLAAINKSSPVEFMRQYIFEHGRAEQLDSSALWSSFHDLR